MKLLHIAKYKKKQNTVRRFRMGGNNKKKMNKGKIQQCIKNKENINNFQTF